MFYKIWHAESLTHWTRITAKAGDIAYADKEVLDLETRLFPNRAGRLADPELLKRMVNHNIEPIDPDRYRRKS